MTLRSLFLSVTKHSVIVVMHWLLKVYVILQNIPEMIALFFKTYFL